MAHHRSASILHVDLDAFYASVEQQRRPELRGKPIAVGGGVVLAASYEARAFGVHAAMPLGKARKLCPQLIVVDGSFGDYLGISDRVFDLCRDVTPLVEQISIDEAFLDVSGAIHLFGTPAEIGARIRRDVRGATGLAISVGVASTKFLAKVASQVAKPDGMVVVDPATEIDFLHALPVRLIWGVGPVTDRRLREMGIRTIGELAHTDAGVLARHLGKGAGAHLNALAWNRDTRHVRRDHRAGSVGAQRAFGGDHRDPGFHREVIVGLADRIGTRLRKKSRAGRTVSVRVRFSDQQVVSRATTLRAPIATTAAISQIAEHLVEIAIAEAAAGRGLSLIGISISKLVVSPHVQLELPLGPGGLADPARAGSMTDLERTALDAAVDALRERFGKDTVSRASAMVPGRGGVPDEFGDLAIPVSERAP
jgi:DNA polymerase-4